MDSQTKVFYWANKVYEFMMKTRSPGNWEYAYGHASEMAYGEALYRWHKDGCNPNSYFSTEDPDMLALKDSFKQEFGLDVVSRAEGIEREKRMTTYRKNVDGWLN